MTAYAILVVLALMGVWGVSKRIVTLADRAEGRASATPTLRDDELERYRAALAGTARPTATQIEAFAEYVATAHSWYKHLPWWPPGVQFVFFLDPAAGMDLSLGDGGTIVPVARQERGFHYSTIPTAEYQDRFGCLTCSDRRGTKVYLVRDLVKSQILEDDADSFLEPSTGTRVHLPKVVSIAGAAGLSGIIHYEARTDHAVVRALTWRRKKRKDGAEFRFSNDVITLEQARTLAEEEGHFYWPDQSGGTSRLLDIIDRVAQTRKDPTCKEPLPLNKRWFAFNADSVLEKLLEPEKDRQLGEIVAACQRVCDLVYGRP